MTDESLAALYENCFPDDVNIWRAESIRAFRRGVDAHIFEGDGVAAFLSLVGDEAELISLFVSPAVRRKGEGQQMFSIVYEFCRSRGVRSIFLEVAADNNSALLLYQKVGFEFIGKRKKYYARKNGSKIDALTMKCEI